MNLAETQELFWELLQGRERPLGVFVGSADLPAEERVAIYARMFLHRQVDALREMFPKVVAALGAEALFEAPPAESLTPEEFATLAQDPVEFMHYRVRLIPALRLLELEHDIGPLWDETAAKAAQLPTQWVVWRSGFDVFHVAVNPDEARAVWLALAGASLADVCAALDDPQRATEALQSWLAEGWIAAGNGA